MPFNSASTSIDVELTRYGQSHRLKEDIFYYDTESSIRILAEKGFKTDLATIPWFLKWTTISNEDFNIIRPSIIHDWCYRWSGKLPGFTFNDGYETTRYPRAIISRAQADKIFYNALRSEKCSFWKSLAMWAAVRVGGWYAWD